MVDLSIDSILAVLKRAPQHITDRAVYEAILDGTDAWSDGGNFSVSLGETLTHIDSFYDGTDGVQRYMVKTFNLANEGEWETFYMNPESVAGAYDRFLQCFVFDSVDDAMSVYQFFTTSELRARLLGV
jgi:hypothetical protein